VSDALHIAQTRVLAAHTALDAITLADAIAVRDALLAAHEQIAALTAEMDLLRAQCQEHELRRNQANARAGTLTSRVVRLEHRVAELSGDNAERFLVTDIEITRVKTLLEDLRADPEMNAPTINGVLNALARITEQGRAQAYGVAAGQVAA
jgi:chromosome segregation ATPase